MATNRYKSILTPKWVPAKTQELDIAALRMATDIHRGAVIFAPKATRALANSGRIVKIAIGVYRVIFGGGPVPYAKRRHYENKKNPQTLRYLERSGDNVSKNKRKYIK